jgi:hypothetical protein
MINAFKQIRLTNINVSGNNGRIEAGASGSFAFLSELNASESALSNTIATTGADLYSLLTGASGTLAGNTANSLFALSSDLATASGDLNTKIDTVSGNLNTYIDDRISDVIDMAPAALDTLKELATSLNNETGFAVRITNDLATTGSSLYASLTGVSGHFSSTNKQFTVNVNNGIESAFVAFPGAHFSSVPTVQATVEGDEVIYGLILKNRSVSGFNVYFSDVVQESNVVLNVFASNQ